MPAEIKERRTRAIGRERQLMVITAVAAIIEFGAAYRAVNLPADVTISLSRPFEAIAALVWALLLTVATWRVAWYRERNLRTSVYVLVGFIVYSLARLLIFTRADYDHNRLRFLTVVTILVLIASVVYLMRPVVRRVLPGATYGELS
ncbi:MAG: hypothetical protein ABI700_28185 [Chloroflexota bacterium]